MLIPIGYGYFQRTFPTPTTLLHTTYHYLGIVGFKGLRELAYYLVRLRVRISIRIKTTVQVGFRVRLRVRVSHKKTNPIS